jgi:two-component system, cell cycle sensor histidine kinase and response regulator CckA
MIAIATPPASYGYYVGIIISMMFGYTLIRERFIYASAAGTLLLVAIGNAMLTRLSYRVTASQDSIAAVKIFRKRPADFDIVITDMSMPGKNGMELSQAIRAIRSDIPIILYTGYSTNPARKNAHALGVHDILMKPLRIQTLATTVRQAINDGQISSR